MVASVGNAPLRDALHRSAVGVPLHTRTLVAARLGLTNVGVEDACHLRHGQKIYDAPRDLLKAIPGITFVETADSDLCCGSAGVYNYLQPEMARALLDRKVANLLATGAGIVATGNPGCLAWIEQGIAKTGGNVPEVVHPIELLDRAYTPYK